METDGVSSSAPSEKRLSLSILTHLPSPARASSCGHGSHGEGNSVAQAWFQLSRVLSAFCCCYRRRYHLGIRELRVFAEG